MKHRLYRTLVPDSFLGKATASIVVVGLLVVAGLILYPSKPAIPGPVKAKLTSTLFVPRGGDYHTDRESAKYDEDLKLLTYRTEIRGVTTVIVTQQSTPDQFVDIPTYGDKVFEQLGEYKTFDTAIGKVHLLRTPKDQKQAAGINAQGTLMFVKPERDMSEDEWRKFFNRMVVVR